MHDIIEKHGDVSIEVSDFAPPDYYQTLAAIEFGSDGLRYRRLDVQRHIQRLGDSFFFVARRHGSAIGIFALTPRELLFDGEIIQSVYRSQLGIVDSERRKGIATQLRHAAKAWIADHFAGKAFLSWGCVDADNSRVLRLLAGEGMLALGELESYLCYRQWPRLSSNILSQNAPTERSERRSTDTLALRPVLSSTAEILCDRTCDDMKVEVDRVQIQLCDYGSAAKFLYQTVLRFVGPARRRFDPQNFSYVKLSNLDFTAAEKKAVERLICHSMAMHSSHYAVFVCDPRLENHANIRVTLGRFTRTTTLKVIIENNGLPEALISHIQARPLRLSPLDI